MPVTLAPEPQLASPGRGLPPIEAFVARHIVFPLTAWRMSDTHAIQRLIDRGQQALSLAQSLSPEQLAQRQLIERIHGIEDSSRYWSVLMTIEHLLMTGEGMARMVETLAQGKVDNRVVRIEDVKPTGERDAESTLAAYHAFLATYHDRMTPILTLDIKTHRHLHPWFGALNARQWLCLNAMHTGLHLTQIQRIARHY